MYNNYVVAGCGFVFIAATVIPWIYHIIHLMWRIIDDLEYVPRKHGFFVHIHWRKLSHWLRVALELLNRLNRCNALERLICHF